MCYHPVRLIPALGTFFHSGGLFMNSPPLEFLVTSSQAGLENFGLGKLNKIANLRRELHEVVEAWIECEIQYRLARWILDCRRTQDAAEDLRTSEPSVPLPLRHAAANLLPTSGEPVISGEPQAQSVAEASVSNSSPHSRRESPAPRRVLPLPRPGLSERAQDALNFLEQHGRMQTDTLGQDVQKCVPDTDRIGTSLPCAEKPVHHRNSRKASLTPSLFPTAPECFEEAAGAGGRSQGLAANSSAKRNALKDRAAAGSAGSAVVAQIVPLVRREKLRTSGPVRASTRFLPPQRKAV
jgi:hypothetical protein